MKIPFKSMSQANQDVFAFSIGHNSGTYIEVGACKPRSKNNTYNLEMLGWSGFSIEIDENRYKKDWDKSDRKNKIFWGDAITFDYLQAITELNLPKHLTYLSCDIEPPSNTFAALKKIIESGISFDCITFEHDKYQSSDDFDTISREFLKKHGYNVAVYDVFAKTESRMFETWFVNSSIPFQLETYKSWLKIKND